MAPTMVEHVVADAAAFLKKAPLQDIGRNIYTLREVVNEIRDKTTRRSLAFLPYQLHFKEPHPEHIRHVTEFSKKTGDYPSLSSTDIKVLALTYELELEHVGSQHLRREPEVKVNVEGTRLHPETPVHVAGFHFPSKRPVDGGSRQTDTTAPTSGDEFNSFQFWRDPLPSLDQELLQLLDPEKDQDLSHKRKETLPDSDKFNSFQFWRDPVLTIDDGLLDLMDSQGSVQDLDPVQGVDCGTNTSGHTESQSDKDKENESEEDDDDGGWITPSNIKQVKMDSPDWTVPTDVRVGCLTTDFAMQNVLTQIGLHVLAINGMIIKQARNHILRCHACFRTTSNMDKVFCPHCGNQTLKKVAVTLKHDGTIKMHFSKNPRVLNPRGLRHSLPLPQGGKHANNPQLVEDQRAPQQRLSRKARQKTDVFNPDYVAGVSPFSENDIYSRAANLHIRDGHCGGGVRRANPNAARKKFVKKK
ncbi:RNA-binding protein NOB1 isoform X2 [Echeneis naucrates]|uniref:RNA-binding protein NOB1 isoform X2 n=1 Tax=Echeneis naucrates TaxID=173247 RepID=UPI00111462CF|nr:RNA-binding protein NOB1 isoform X2 [Echeneis naucrates]